MGTLSREIYAGKMANVLRGNVSLENNGGFIQMATNLCLNQEDYLDASAYDGIELDVKCEAEGKTEFFNVQ